MIPRAQNLFGTNWKIKGDLAKVKLAEFMEEHEMLAPNVSRTIYSDGSEILANYSDADFVYRGRTVRPLSFILVK